MPRIDLIKLRRGTATEWESVNPTLADGEYGYEKDTKKSKIGDGSTAWNDLDYLDVPTASSLPPIENVYADIAEMLANQGSQTTGFLQEVTDASADPNIVSGTWFYKKKASSTGTLATDYTPLTQGEITALLDSQGKQTADCGTVIPLDTVYGHNCNMQSANANTAYTINNENLINAYARVLINATSEPTVSGATQRGGVSFVADTNMILLVENLGDAGIVYSFNPVSVNTGEADTLQTVTTRGATTTTKSIFQGNAQVGDVSEGELDFGTNGSQITVDGGEMLLRHENNNYALDKAGMSVEIVSISGNWNASTNSPTLANTDTGVKAVEYKVSIEGTVDFGAGDIIFNVGDIVANDGSIWYKKVDNNQSYTITSADITIPSTIYACVGFETNIYYDALIPCFDNGLATKTNVEIICAKGQSFQDRWALTATSPDVGTETMTINVYDDNNNLIATKSVSLNIVEDSGDSISANILMIGDSLTSAGTITSTLRTSLLTFTGITPTFYGSQGTSPNNQEGRAGWAFSSFVGATSPFYNGGVIDIANYRSSVLSSAPQFDIVIIQLGVNDSFDNDVKTDAEITAILDDAKTLIDAFIADNSDSKIIVQLPTLCANTLDGWADDYDATRKRNNYKKNIFLLRKAILNDFDLGAYNSNVSVGKAGLSVDRYYGYPRSSGNPATRLTGDTVERHTNALHPTEGYAQIADGILGQVLNFIEESGTSLGSELIVNGDFSSSPMSYANGWFSIDSGVRIENNELWLEDLATNCRAYATNGTNLEVLTQTKSYRLEYTVVENLENSQLKCYYNGVYNQVPDVVGTHVVTFTQNSTSKSFIFSNLGNDSGKIIKIDNVSLKEIL